MRLVASAFAVGLLLLPGCAVLDEPAVREISGPTDGYSPTPSYLKLAVEREDGSVALLAFDRADWHAAEIARRVDRHQIDFITAQAKPRDILSEYLVHAVVAPEELDTLRYDTMRASAEERRLMDEEYTRLLEDWAADLPAPEALPTATLPLEGTLA